MKSTNNIIMEIKDSMLSCHNRGIFLDVDKQFKYEDVTYTVVEWDPSVIVPGPCRSCDLVYTIACNIMQCTSKLRRDNKPVIFRKLTE